MKRMVVLFSVNSLVAMDNPDHPRYHINNKIVYLREMNASGEMLPHPDTQDFRTVSEFNRSFNQDKPTNTENDVAIIKYDMSNRTKIVLAGIGACSSILLAAISAAVTYFSTKC